MPVRLRQRYRAVAPEMMIADKERGLLGWAAARALDLLKQTDTIFWAPRCENRSACAHCSSVVWNPAWPRKVTANATNGNPAEMQLHGPQTGQMFICRTVACLVGSVS